jgi:hypothetical protein
MILWWHRTDLEKIRAATAAYALLLRDASWYPTAKRLARRWERITTKAATSPEHFYAPLMECAADVTSSCWDYATAKAHLTAMRELEAP